MRCASCLYLYQGHGKGRCPGWKEGCNESGPIEPRRQPNHSQNRADWAHAEMHPFEWPPWTNYPEPSQRRGIG